MGSITTTRWATGQANSLAIRIHGDKGGIRLDLDKSYDEYEICSGKNIHTSAWKTIKVKSTPNMHKRFIKAIKTGINDSADFERGYQIQKVLDATIASDKQQNIIHISK
jgi:predicted dehydrogenase